MIIIPGLQLLSNTFLAFVFFFFLMFLFLGISVIADIFMEAIEVITSTTQRVEFPVGSGNHVEIPIWNATIANLTLMALGSSAPEILLAIIETAGSLGEKAGELGPSTIVGSAAFNLLVISAVCIPSVDEPKKIFDMGVFCTTACFSLFAYLWLYFCLAVWTPEEVTQEEGWMTLGFFMCLVILAFLADKYNQRKVKRSEDLADEKEKEE
jgi:solute carrier family 8 (sodium/calcium exchanger)